MSALDEYKHFLASFVLDADSKQIRNGYAIYLCTKGATRKHGLNYAASALEEFLMQDSRYTTKKNYRIYVYSHLKTLENKIFNLKKKINVNWSNNKIQTLLLQPFNVSWMEKIKPLPCTSTSTDNESIFPQEGTQDVFLSEATQQSDAPLPVIKLRTDCTQCHLIRQRYVTKCKTLEEKVKSLKSHSKFLSKSSQVKVLTQTIKRKIARVKRLKREKTMLKKRVRLLERQLGVPTSKMDKCSLLSRRNYVLQKKELSAKVKEPAFGVEGNKTTSGVAEFQNNIEGKEGDSLKVGWTHSSNQFIQLST